MKKLFILVFITTILAGSLSSCASIINLILGYNECSYPDCTRECADNCHYCSLHCDRDYLPDDFNKRIGSAIDKQVEQSRQSYQNRN